MICYGQPIAAVIAETREIARNASYLVKIEYQDLKVILTQEVTCVDSDNVCKGVGMGSIHF